VQLQPLKNAIHSFVPILFSPKQISRIHKRAVEYYSPFATHQLLFRPAYHQGPALIGSLSSPVSRIRAHQTISKSQIKLDTFLSALSSRLCSSDHTRIMSTSVHSSEPSNTNAGEPMPQVSTPEVQQDRPTTSSHSTPNQTRARKKSSLLAGGEPLRKDVEDESKGRRNCGGSFRHIFRLIPTLMIPERRYDKEPTVRESIWEIIMYSRVFLVYHTAKHLN
jgi:hypothetical protein